MSAERKRRRTSPAWSLPVVVAIMFLLAARLVSWQREEVFARLDQTVSHGSTGDATSAVRHMATTFRPPVALLVKASASPNLAVAREAQHAIDDYLRICQRDLVAGRHESSIARQLGVIAKSLAEEQSAFPVADYAWVEKTTRKVLLLANRIPTRKTPLIAARCDEVLAAVADHRIVSGIETAANANNRSRPRYDFDSVDTHAKRSVLPTAQSEVRRRDERFAALAAQPWSHGFTFTSNGRGVIARPLSATPAVGGQNLRITLEADGGPMPASDFEFSVEATSDDLRQESDHSGWRAQWTHPVLRSLPARPIGTPAKSHDRSFARAQSINNKPTECVSDVAGSFDTAGAHFEGVHSRQLLKRWLVAEGSSVYPLEQELTERGFGRLSARLVEKMFSERVEDRLRLIDDVLMEPGVDARPWLMLLAEDSDSDVRLVTLTIMATSNDAGLIEKAWQVSIRDHDPRVAGLAERLRERRGDAQRR